MRQYDKQGYIQKKRELAMLSSKVRQLVKMGVYAGINEGLKDLYTQDLPAEHESFNTFAGWKVEGYKVKKGEKGFAIWSTPRLGHKENENIEAQENAENPEVAFQFFGLAYLFSNTQVEKIQERELVEA